MIRKLHAVLVLGALSIVSCQQGTNQQGEGKLDAGTAAEVPAPAGYPARQSSTPAPAPATVVASPDTGENDGSPDITPAALSGDAAKGEKGARNLLLAWARGIELREFDQAWDLMGGTAKAQLSKAQFNARFHPLKNITVAVPAGTMEGAAGSSYYTAPTTVTGNRADGTKVTLKGEVVLRRVNDVPGATPEQLAWHIEQVNLSPA